MVIPLDYPGRVRYVPTVEAGETTVLTSQLLVQQEAEKVADGLQRFRTLLPDVRLWLTVPEHLRFWAEPRFSQLAELAFLPDNYSARIEREVVAKLSGRRIPSRESSRSHGIAVMDLEYVLATVDALVGVSPFMQKRLTISGEGIDKAVTVRFPLGTSLRHIPARCHCRS